MKKIMLIGFLLNTLSMVAMNKNANPCAIWDIIVERAIAMERLNQDELSFAKKAAQTAGCIKIIRPVSQANTYYHEAAGAEVICPLAFLSVLPKVGPWIKNSRNCISTVKFADMPKSQRD